MCGVVGSVGKSTDTVKSYNLLTNLMRETKRRGPHATGHYYVDLKGKVHTHKSPVSADLYVRGTQWKESIRGHCALIGHARFTTHGSEGNNENNHPFVSKSGNIALVHNGVLFLYDELKDKYRLQSECDSELILRIISKEKDPLRGIKKVYELLGSGGDFACELIHLNPKTGKTMFYFFRDNGRPGKMIDARDTFGQLIFCSEKDIWNDAVLKSGMPREVRQLSVRNIPDYQILAVDADSLKVKEIKVEKPKFKSRYARFSHNKHTTYYNRNNYYHYNGSTKTSRETSLARCGTTFNTSVLGEGWIETTNPDTNLPRFIYDPNETGEDNTINTDFSDANGISQTSEEEQDSAFRVLLQRCVDDPTLRYPGWQDEAYSYYLITEEEWYQFTNDDSKSNDALDGGIGFDDIMIDDDSYDGDSIAAYQLFDEQTLSQLASQQNVDGDDEGEI